MKPFLGHAVCAVLASLSCRETVWGVQDVNRPPKEDAAPKVEWLHGHGTDQGEHVFEGMQTRDGGFIAVGTTWEAKGHGSDALVIKTDEKGKLQWQRVLGEKGSREEGRCIVEARDGYYLGGVLTEAGLTGPGLLKLDAKGTVEWTKTYPGPKHGAVRGIDLAGNGLALTGYVDCPENAVPFIADDAAGFVMKTDLLGKPLWRKTLDAPQGTKVKIDRATGALFVCSTVWAFSEGRDHQDAQLTKLDASGVTLWKKTYGGRGQDQCFDMDLTPDGCVLAGHTTGDPNGGWDAWLVKVNRDGTRQWSQTYGQPLGGSPKQIYDECYGVKATPDGGFVLACGTGVEPENAKTRKDPRSTWAAYVVRTDARGNKLWHHLHHTPNKGHNAAEYVALCRDGGYVVFLDSDNTGSMKNSNVGFLKLALAKKGGK